MVPFTQLEDFRDQVGINATAAIHWNESKPVNQSVILTFLERHSQALTNTTTTTVPLSQSHSVPRPQTTLDCVIEVTNPLVADF
uniref:Uncharacterized protein n=1 Tax=Steinernema glaseri TaxID=37863 RepID=A0A1I7Z6K8_9BILA